MDFCLNRIVVIGGFVNYNSNVVLQALNSREYADRPDTTIGILGVE